MNTIMNDIETLQQNYQELMNGIKVTKKDICELVIPFRDKYHLKDSQALQIARNELSISEINELMNN